MTLMKPKKTSPGALDFLKRLAELSGAPQLASDVAWTATHPVDRVLGRGRSAQQSMVVASGPNRLFRETSLQRLLPFLKGQESIAMQHHTPFFASLREMAVGQGNNKGVLMELDPKAINVEPYQGKPGLSMMDPVEFMGRFNTQQQYQSALRSFTIQKGAPMDRVMKRKIAFLLDDLKRTGWKSELNPDGSMTFTKPVD